MLAFALAALAGVIWACQFVCQKVGEPAMGDMRYISFAVVMGSCVLFSSLLGVVLGEWRGTGARTRDWVDTISCSEDIQPLAYLVWAANGKDQGLTPNFILDMCARTTYVQRELDMVIRSEKPVDAAVLSRKWHEMIDRARETVKLLPPAEVGKVVMTREGDLFRGTDEELRSALASGGIVFHEGVIGGAWPTIVES